LSAYWAALSAALVVSTVLTLIVTASVFRLVAKLTGRGGDDQPMPHDAGRGV
jgi:putative effector of murein hydrolase LrgA (UPF0299 family)